MSGEAFLGFTAFNNRKATGIDVIDFVKYRQLVAGGETLDEALFEQVLAPPKAEE
jgi:6-oxo-cyclohex-1-ene-carbonyl-CoA hydrolase